MKFDNILSLVLGSIELFCFSGICFGFPFIEFILREEQILKDEFCENVDQEGLCNKALQQYNLIFTLAVTSSVSILFVLLFVLGLTPRLAAWPLRSHTALSNFLGDILKPTKFKMSQT